jgi:hypothetical protein
MRRSTRCPAAGKSCTRSRKRRSDLVAERRGSILGFLYATLEETSARIVFLAVRPEYRRRGIGTALHHERKAHIPREAAFVGVYALLDSPVIPFLEKIGCLPVSSIYGWIATRDLDTGAAMTGPSSFALCRHLAGDRDGPLTPPALSAQIRALSFWGPVLCLPPTSPPGSATIGSTR